MPDSWEPVNMLPDDGRTAAFTRSVNEAGNPIHFVTPVGLLIVEGHFDELTEAFVMGNVVAGEPEGGLPAGWEAGWVPTHFYNDIGEPVGQEPPVPDKELVKATRRRHPRPQAQPDPGTAAA